MSDRFLEAAGKLESRADTIREHIVPTAFDSDAEAIGAGDGGH
jgi:hypothetical protein